MSVRQTMILPPPLLLPALPPASTLTLRFFHQYLRLSLAALVSNWEAPAWSASARSSSSDSFWSRSRTLSTFTLMMSTTWGKARKAGGVCQGPSQRALLHHEPTYRTRTPMLPGEHDKNIHRTCLAQPQMRQGARIRGMLVARHLRYHSSTLYLPRLKQPADHQSTPAQGETPQASKAD